MNASFPLLTALLFAPLAAPALAENGPTNIALRDEQGRGIVPNGYVTLTEDGKGNIHYTPDDYRRMVRMGREAGLQTVFKLVIYDIRPFGNAQWDAIYHNTNGTQDAVLAAWSKLWNRYKDEPSAFGYDLQPDAKLGSTEIFVSADRFYPEGFRVEVGAGLTLALNPGVAELNTLHSADETNREQANLVQWDTDSQHLAIKKWIVKSPSLTVTISPLPKRP